MEKYIIYQGLSFTTEWYYNKSRRSQAFEYYQNLPTDVRIEILRLIKRIDDIGKIKHNTKFNYAGEKLYAFKPHPERFLCFFIKDKK